MPLHEKDLADTIVSLRKMEWDNPDATVSVCALIAAHESHLEREQWWRAQMMAQTTAAGGVNPQGDDR